MIELNSSKLENKEQPKISVITVVYNSERYIEKTINSIINQTYPNIEYIIIDGGSTDGTIAIIKKYEEYLTKWISEIDDGLYYAMNKGIKTATGDYIWFINSGDEIYTENTAEDIFSSINQTVDIIYGETEIIDFKGNSLRMRRHSSPEKLTWKSLKYGMKVCHQSILVHKNLIESYNTNYKFSSDFEWVLRMLKKASLVVNSRIILSKFMEGGLTKKSMFASLKERFKIMGQFYGKFPTIFNHIIIGFKLIGHYINKTLTQL